jgi:hypothetical protein
MTDRRVTKEEFESFVASYPTELARNLATAFQPAILSYSDASSGKVWHEAVVAWARLNEDMAGRQDYPAIPNEYYLAVGAAAERA